MRKGFGVLLMLIGAAMLLCAGWMLKTNDQEERAAGTSAERVLEAVEKQVAAEILNPTPTENANAVDGNVLPTAVPEMPTIEIDGNEYIGYLEMPTIEIKLPIMSDWSYDQLKIAPCRYWGSAYDDTLVILGHNYRRHFHKIKQLEIGDPVQFIDANGNIYAYRVAEMEVLNPNEVEKMVASDYALTLFTCTYGGTARQAVRCERVLTF